MISEFFGHRIKERVGIAIVAAEGMGTLSNRIEAAKVNLGISENLPIAYFPLDGDLADEAALTALAELLVKIAAEFRAHFNVRLGAVMIDTIAAAFAMDDENANAEASGIIRGLRKLAVATNAVVIAVHHYGKARDAGLRGASGFRAGADAVLSVTADRNEATGDVRNRSLALAKSRTGEEGPISGFDLIPVWLGRDEDGDEYGSCSVAPNSATASRARDKSEPLSNTMFRAAFAEALTSEGLDQSRMIGRPEGRAVPIAFVRNEFSKRRPATNGDEKKRADAARKAFANALARLASEFTTVTDGHGVEWIWSTA